VENHYSDQYEKSHPQYMIDCAYRIFADHIRTIVISLLDGVEFSFEGRGSVLRKIMKRMLTYVYLYLNQMTIEHLMQRPIIKGVTYDVLNYHMKRIYDLNQIHEQLIEEEKKYFGVLRNLHSKIGQIIKKNERKSTNRSNNSSQDQIILVKIKHI